MKKRIRFFLCLAVIVLIATSTASAVVYNYSGVSLSRGTGTYVGSAVKSGTGKAGLAAATANGASMYMQVRKPDGVGASEYRIFNGTGSDSAVPYMNDGNGNSLGRDGYTYKCRLAHRSQSSVTSTTASGGWWP